jgi:hypothetical protein
MMPWLNIVLASVKHVAKFSDEWRSYSKAKATTLLPAEDP